MRHLLIGSGIGYIGNSFFLHSSSGSPVGNLLAKSETPAQVITFDTRLSLAALRRQFLLPLNDQ